MKKILLTLIILISLTACESKKSNSTKKNVEEIETTISDSETELTELEKEAKLRTEINDKYLAELSKCSQNVNAVTDFNGKTEFWNICEMKNGNRIITIDSHNKDTYYQEIYFEKSGELIYAKETENYMPKNHFTQMSWNCEFYAKNGELIALMSLGHGKTEDEEWNPDVIFEMYKNRLSELKRIKK